MRKLIDQTSSELDEIEAPDTLTLPWFAGPAKDADAFAGTGKDAETTLQKAVKGTFVNGLGDNRRMLSRGEFHALMKHIAPKLEGEFLDQVFLKISHLDYEKLI